MTAAENIAAAIKGLPPEGYAKVRAADVLAVCQAVADAGQTTDTTDALLLGASGALRVNPEIDVWQQTGALAELLKIAGA